MIYTIVYIIELVAVPSGLKVNSVAKKEMKTIRICA